MNLDLMRELVEGHGVPSREEAIRSTVKRELGGLGDLSVDKMGNLTCFKAGKEGGIKVMIAAHMDEIGFIVKHIDKDGFLRIQPLGGFDPRQMNSQRVKITTKTEVLQGVLMYGTKPKHMLTDAEAAAGQKVDGFFVDCGLSGDEAKARIQLGDMVTMDRNMVEMGSLLTCKTMDDRIGVFVMVEAMKQVGNHEANIYAVATVQEEIGLRGAAAAGSRIQPDVVIALDVTLANDIPGITEQDHVTKLGQGTAIKIMDSSLVCSPQLVAHFEAIAEKHGINHQMEILPAGGTDAGAVQRLNGGIPAITLSIPCRYIHTVNETVHRDDVQASIDLLARFLEEAHLGNFQPE